MNLGFQGVIAVVLLSAVLIGGAYIKHVVSENALLQEQVTQLEKDKKALEDGIAAANAASKRWQGEYYALKKDFKRIDVLVRPELARDPSAACVLSDGVLQQLRANIETASR